MTTPTPATATTATPTQPASGSVIPPSPKLQRKVLEKLEGLEQRIERDRYDTEAWTNLLGEVAQWNIEHARPYYERFFDVYPTAGKYWRMYAEHEMRAKRFDRVEKIFMRCLLSCLNVELWKCYLDYIRTIKDERASVEERDEIQRAYEFTLEHVGLDIGASPIWTDYIEFLKTSTGRSGPVASGTSSTVGLLLPHQYDVSAVRRAFQRSVVIPMQNLDKLHEEYEQWERELSPTLANTLLPEYLSKFKSAWNAFKEKRSLREHLMPNMLARPPRFAPVVQPDAPLSVASLKEEEQVVLWKQLVHFEKRNVQRLQPAQLKQRVVFAYNQALLCLYHHPDVWYDFVAYLIDNNALDEAKNTFERGIKALPANILLHFTYADFEESRKNISEAKNIYERLLERRTDPIVFVQYQKFARRAEGINAAREVFLRARKIPGALTWHLYAASGLMEFNLNNDPKAAVRVFEHGLKQSMHEPEYILEYLDLLYRMNDVNNTRVLFERVLSSGTLQGEKGLEIWNRFLKFEYTFGDPNSIAKVEKRRIEAHPQLELNPLRAMVDRFRFRDIWPATAEELEYIDLKRPLLRVAKDGAESGQEVTAAATSSSVRPDCSRMIEFRPGDMSLARPPLLAPGGAPMGPHVPAVPPAGRLPDVVARIMAALPPPHAITGPLPDIEFVIDALLNVPLLFPPPSQPLIPSPNEPAIGGHGPGIASRGNGRVGRTGDRDQQERDSDRETRDRDTGAVAAAPKLKRKKDESAAGESSSDSEGDDQSGRSKPSNIYRQRRQQKLSKFSGGFSYD